ncbi:hypothetical protein SMICM304S_04440 [Streptomyces microflavus]
MQASMTRTRPMNGRGYGGMEDDDNRRGPERDETDTDLFRQLVGHLVADGDGRAAAAGRQVRRTSPRWSRARPGSRCSSSPAR